MRKDLVVVPALACLLLTVACGDGERGKERVEAEAETAKKAPSTKIEETPGIFILETPPVDPETLQKCLSEGDEGWSAGKTESRVEVFGAGSISRVERTYSSRQGEATMRVAIIDTNRSSVLAAPFETGSMMSETFTDGFRKFSKAGGWPTIRELRGGEGFARISVLVAERYIVEMSGSGADPMSRVEEFWGRMRGRLDSLPSVTP